LRNNRARRIENAMLRASDSAHAGGRAERLLIDRFRCRENFADLRVTGRLSDEAGYFRLGADVICYGQCASGVPAKAVTDSLHDASQHAATGGPAVHLPFDPAQVVDNLRCERYALTSSGVKTLPANGISRGVYYLLRPALGVSVRKRLQRRYFRGWEQIPFPRWPVDRTVEDIFEYLLILSMTSQGVQRVPFIWFWPDGVPSCTIMTHDVETSAGLNFCSELMDLNDSFGVKSSFQIIPEKRYTVSQMVLENIRNRGFEINVHDLNHDGRLMCNWEEFKRRAERINVYGRQLCARGFRSAVMYRNSDWYDELDFSYDMSMPNVAHLDPQQGGCCTVLPFFIGKILELPLTTTQDYSLWNILQDYSIRLWKEQISLIREKSGLISFIIHPDYNIDRKARRVYSELLQHLADLRSQGETWIALPGEVDSWWRLRSELSLVNTGNSWSIEGEGKERARLAYAVLEGNRLTYEITPSL
jgi:hypothetical protein